MSQQCGRCSHDDGCLKDAPADGLQARILLNDIGNEITMETRITTMRTTDADEVMVTICQHRTDLIDGSVGIGHEKDRSP